ncbi:M20/M25/M40 family metallo-hydrolase [Hyphococcus sp.]|uniref:M20/M25/M40 family metallo-hydrolase n=1 Tax=Hyphococcus sp. TaxID=2038636 RepID=UPI003D12CE71
MRKNIIAMLAAAAAAATFSQQANAQEAPPPALTEAQAATVDRLIDAGLEDDLAWDLLESLTTEVGPRLGGSPAEARAREWGVRELKRLGFKNVRIETYEMPYWARISESAEIVSPFPQPLAVTALGRSRGTPEGGVAGEVVRFRTLLELQDAPETGLEGKIVFVDEPMARTQDGSGYGTAVRKRSQAAVEAGKRGAVAALIRSAGTDSHRNPHTGGALSGAGETAVPTAALSNPDADQLARALERAKAPVIVKLDLQVETAESVISGNVIGEIPGQTDEIIVIGGHLDSWDLGTGAIDDASGIAITTAAAKLVGDLKGKPKRTIRVVMWGAEEVGIYGGKAYAEAHKDEMDKHVLAAESDFGAGRVYRFDTRFSDEEAPKGKVFEAALRRLAVTPGNNMAFGGADIGATRDLGVPVVSLRQDGTDYFDLHHTPDDTLDKVDPEDLRQNVAAWAAFVYIASELEGDFGRLPVKETGQ